MITIGIACMHVEIVPRAKRACVAFHVCSLFTSIDIRERYLSPRDPTVITDVIRDCTRDCIHDWTPRHSCELRVLAKLRGIVLLLLSSSSGIAHTAVTGPFVTPWWIVVNKRKGAYSASTVQAIFFYFESTGEYVDPIPENLANQKQKIWAI